MRLDVIRNLGSGGFGTVDLVKGADGLEYAKKTFCPAQPLTPAIEENVKKRFAREARIQSGIKHRNIVPVVHTELDENPPYYLMPRAICSLQDDIDRDRTLGGKWITAITDIVAALDELHNMGIYHRDLKPQNVLKYQAILPGGEIREYYAISDFGLIAMNESRLSVLTVTGMAKGTDYYTAPEITSDLRKATAQSDIYSLGCILHDIVGSDPRVPCAEIKEGGDFGAILRNCTRADADRRFKSVRAVLDAINSASADALPTSIATKTPGFGDQLSLGEPLDEQAAKALVQFVEDNEGDAPQILDRLSLAQVQDLCSKWAGLGDRLGQIYSKWVMKNSFVFERCDSLANVLEAFFSLCSMETKADALMAMLEMGTSHNRWYVERKFLQLCGSKMDETTARRLSIEFRASGDDICRLIAHLERSVGASRTELHPFLQTVLTEVCR
ncbi:serine/threonine-protein kinase [Bradyrhizobium sp. CCGB20]|uniref:serine/threonine protein kinase n=1 Tax=Bradyrhizobium sp. CCGB20 TaxID=2949633 RepID=UPI0020B35914|nr:serine/threonine-protein kinase [Bradyrhizobium sp. CCGB20]MCP3403171.1 serine/threonine protein kinase [Bradyrhizobium sp. CCGB20]